jgi:multiple sugar transport system permease protein
MTAVTTSPPRRIRSSHRRSEAITGYLFVSPSILGFLLFVLGPVVAALLISFTRYDIVNPPEFIGVDNYTRMLDDTRLIKSYGNTLLYVAAAVILINALGLMLAVLINRKMPKPLTYVLRSAYFFPSLVALVYVSVIWQALFQRDTGIVNYYVAATGGPRVDWLNSPGGSIWSVIIVDTWRNVGFAMLIFLAALQEVPKELIEAAEIDGAGALTRFWRITVPLISPAVFFTITITVIGAFQIYESIIVLTGGGPGDSSRSIVMYIAEQAFQQQRMGYASAIAMTLFLIILLVTALQFRFRRKWVHSE